jgi:ribosomal 50S subunit-recycling heat shock protein
LFYNVFVRLDLYLKSSRLVKRRAVARELCDNGRVLVNDRQAKPGKELKQGDAVTLQFSTRLIELEVISIPPAPARNMAPQDLYRVRAEKRINTDSDSWNKNL